MHLAVLTTLLTTTCLCAGAENPKPLRNHTVANSVQRSSVIVGVTVDECSVYHDCWSCIQSALDVGCGWDVHSQKCRAGNSEGSYDKQASVSTFSWLSFTCDKCSVYPSCLSCSANPGCGWCKLPTGITACLSGTSLGATNETYQCSVKENDWSWHTCNDCQPYSSCTSCLSESGCGWNVNLSRCEPAGDFGSLISSANSTMENWISPSGGCDLPCSRHNVLAACVNDTVNSCGWCSSGSGCVSGSATGSADGSCTLTNEEWFWKSSDPCSRITTCSDCTSHYWTVPGSRRSEDCGWSISHKACLTGTRDGSFDNTSSAVKRDWLFDSCDPCDVFLYPNSCLSEGEEKCGWCYAESMCMTGTSVGSSDGSCLATNNEWMFKSTDACSIYSTCADCQTPKPGSLTCGWNSAQNICLSGNSEGSYNRNATAAAGVWLWETCDPCGRFNSKSCEACRSDPKCGWCSSSGCLSGTDKGSNDGNCLASQEQWFWASCDACANYNTCDDCVNGHARTPCGWCGSFCRTGNINGSYSAEACSLGSKNWTFGTCPTQ